VTVVVCTAEERPDLWERVLGSFRGLWPEYNHHGDLAARYFSVLVPRHARCQVLLYEPASDEVVGRGRTIPIRWDGTEDDLPPGIDAAGLRALEDDTPPTALCALAAEIAPAQRERGLSRRLIGAMVDVARGLGFSSLVAPLRPSWKERYPITPVEFYATWRRADGSAFDPWIRTHEGLGATILRPEARSMRITAPVADWERWTGMSFSYEGAYVFPGGLAPLEVSDGVGHYFEPNVWVLHRT